MGLTEQEKITAKIYANNDATFMFIAWPSLCAKIAKNHPAVQGLPEVFKIMILRKEPIRLDISMITKYCNNILDKKNTWLLDNGDIKVIPKEFR